MKDSLNRNLQIGDRIAFVSCSCKNEFQQIEIGTIEKLCPEYVRINKDKKIDEKYYFINTINDAKVVSFTTKIEQGVKNQNIIIPLISEREVTIDKTVLAFNIEINDKCSFNTCDNYNSDKNSFNNMFDIFSKKITELSDNVLNNKII